MPEEEDGEGRREVTSRLLESIQELTFWLTDDYDTRQLVSGQIAACTHEGPFSLMTLTFMAKDLWSPSK